MCQVDVAANLVTSRIFTSDEQNGGHSPITKVGFTLCQLLQEHVALYGEPLMCVGFNRGFVFVFFGLLVGVLLLIELVAGQYFSLAVVADLDELSREFLILQVEEVLLVHLVVEVLLVGVILFEGGIDCVFKVFVHFCLLNARFVIYLNTIFSDN